MNDRFDYTRIPPDTLEDLEAWVATARPTGGFLRAVLSNDLSEAVGRADERHEPIIPLLVRWLYNKAPGGCWGSPERVEDWRGLDGGAAAPVS